jgi:hypothetical protein
MAGAILCRGTACCAPKGVQSIIRKSAGGKAQQGFDDEGRRADEQQGAEGIDHKFQPGLLPEGGLKALPALLKRFGAEEEEQQKAGDRQEVFPGAAEHDSPPAIDPWIQKEPQDDTDHDRAWQDIGMVPYAIDYLGPALLQVIFNLPPKSIHGCIRNPLKI